MYDDIRNQMVPVFKAVKWYALSEALALSQTIAEVCLYYDENRENDAARKALRRVAEQSLEFLRRNQSSQEFNALQRTLDQLRLEDQQ